MTPREIHTAIQDAAKSDTPRPSDLALLALRDLLKNFIDATDGPSGYPDSMKAMSMNQIHALNKLHLVMGL